MRRTLLATLLFAGLVGQGCIIVDDDDPPPRPPPPAGEAQFDFYWQFASGRTCTPDEEVWIYFDPDYFGEPDKFNCFNSERQGDMSGLTGDLPLDSYVITVVLYLFNAPVQGIPPISFEDSLVVDGQIKQHTVVFED